MHRHCAVITAILATFCGLAAAQEQQLQWRGVWEWSMDHRTEAGLTAMADAAADLGFNVIMCSPPHGKLAFMREQCHARGIKLYLSTIYSHSDAATRQMMTAEQLASRPDEPVLGYQYGGEPLDDVEVFQGELPCWNQPAVREQARERTAAYARLPIDGLALDGIGYINYLRCHCPVCEEQLASFRAKHPRMSPRRSEELFAEETLVEFINEMAATAREANPKIELTIHIWPWYRPNPYYGHRLDLDTAGETVAWFFRPHWPLDKVQRRADWLVAHQQDDYPDHLAAPFIGFDARSTLHARSPKRVREELNLVIASGASAIQVADLGYIMDRPTVAEIFREVLGGRATNDAP